VTFDASASTDADGHVARYHWDFGDGTTQTTADPRTTHVYPRAGTFRATLTVTDNEGCSTKPWSPPDRPSCATAPRPPPQHATSSKALKRRFEA
jgi:hypothetical protein